MRALTLALAILAMAEAAAAEGLREGDTELGMSLSTLSIGTENRVDLALRVGRFFPAPGKFLSLAEAELGYAHLVELDRLDASLLVGISRPWRDDGLHPYLAGSVGVRQEWLGSFQRARYPIGFDLGVRLLLGERGIIRGAYRYRHVFDGGAGDWNENGLELGIGLRFGPR
ncbi:MAG TPA: hypothetical protein VGB13_04305 [Candidatus Krumholzibacteria bacterium]